MEFLKFEFTFEGETITVAPDHRQEWQAKLKGGWVFSNTAPLNVKKAVDEEILRRIHEKELRRNAETANLPWFLKKAREQEDADRERLGRARVTLTAQKGETFLLEGVRTNMHGCRKFRKSFIGVFPAWFREIEKINQKQLGGCNFIVVAKDGKILRKGE